MSIVFDIIIILILASSVYLGYKKGIIDVGFKLLALIISIITALILYSPITYLIMENTTIDEKIESAIIENGIAKEEKDTSIDAYVQNYAKNVVKGTQNAVVEATAKPLTVKIIGIAVMIALFIFTRCILIVIKTFTNILAKLPILKQCNEIAGLAYGLLRGLVIIFTILAIIFFISTMSGWTDLNSFIEKTYITKFLYNNNILMMLW